MKLHEIDASKAAVSLQSDILAAMTKYLHADQEGLSDRLILVNAINAVSGALAQFAYPLKSQDVLDLFDNIYRKHSDSVFETIHMRDT